MAIIGISIFALFALLVLWSVREYIALGAMLVFVMVIWLIAMGGVCGGAAVLIMGNPAGFAMLGVGIVAGVVLAKLDKGPYGW